MKTIILTCDHCGLQGHEADQPSAMCIAGLKEKITDLEKAGRNTMIQRSVDRWNDRLYDHYPLPNILYQGIPNRHSFIEGK